MFALDFLAERTRKKASPLREGDRSGANFSEARDEMREAVAVVGVPTSPLYCIVCFALCKDGDPRRPIAWENDCPLWVQRVRMVTPTTATASCVLGRDASNPSAAVPLPQRGGFRARPGNVKKIAPTKIPLAA